MKKYWAILISLILLGVTFYFQQDIIHYLMVNIIYRNELKEQNDNDYSLRRDYQYVQITDSLIPKSRQDILNIVYTSLDKGLTEFTYFCDTDYVSCLKDTEDLINNKEPFGNINNFVHPYNSYQKLSFNVSTLGRVHITVTHLYTEEQIRTVNKKVEQLYSQLVDNSKSQKDNILSIHDYIINNTVYELEDETWDYSGTQVYPKLTNIAYGPLINGVSICGGYADAMALFLNKMGIKNYRIASSSHIWNLVYIDNKWMHIDLTWDDPVTDNGENILSHTYYLLSTEELQNLNPEDHQFVPSIYIEAKEQ